MYRSRKTPTTEAAIYRIPATLAFLLSEVMDSPEVRSLGWGTLKAAKRFGKKGRNEQT
jgi:nucleoid DNA-binding protein